MLIPEDILIHITNYLPWKTLLLYSCCSKQIYLWIKNQDHILQRSVFVSAHELLELYRKYIGFDKRNNIEILKNIYGRKINVPYNEKSIIIKKLYRNYYFMNPILNEEFKIWSPMFKTSNIETTTDKYIISVGDKYQQSDIMQTWKKMIQTMTVLMYRNIPHAASIRVVSCPYREWDTTPPTPLAALTKVNIYADIYKEGIGKRKRSEVPKKHIPTKYWHTSSTFTQSFHALQCMNLKKGNRARVLTSFQIIKNPANTWEWFLKCKFHKIDIYCY